MSQVVDEKVVQFEFDNSNFEKNVNQSIKTVEKLKNSLEIGPKTQEVITNSIKNIDLSSLNAKIDQIADRFSVFGIAGMTAIQRITNAAIDLGLTLEKKIMIPISAAWNQIITGGTSRAANIEQATFQLKGIFGEAAEGQVKLQMAMTGTSEQIKELTGKTEDMIVAENAANYAVADTAYGLDSAAKAASVLATSGVDVVKFYDELADESGRARTEMQVSLRAISGTAAMANSSYDEIAHIFERVSGQGRVMGQDLESLSSRGLNAAAVLADYLNEVGVTANATQADIKKMCSKGEIDFMTFAKAMDKAYGEHAKDANSTFSGAFDNMRFALSKIGADFIAPVRDDLIPVLNNIRMSINAVRSSLTPFVDAWKSASHYITDNLVARFGQLIGYGESDSEWKASDQWGKAIENITNVVQIATDTLFEFINLIDSIVHPISEAWKEIFPSRGYSGFVEFLNQIKTFISNSKLSTEAMGKLKSVAKGIFSIFKIAGQVIKPVISGIIELAKNFTWLRNILVGSAASFGDRLAEIAESNVVFDTVTKYVNKLVDGFSKLSSNLKSIGPGIKRIASGIVESFFAIKQVLGQKISTVSLDDINLNMDKIHEKAEKIKNFFIGFKDTIVRVFTNVVGILKQLGSKIIETVKGLFSGISDIFSKPSYLKMEKTFDFVNIAGLATMVGLFIKKFANYWGPLQEIQSKYKRLFASNDSLIKSFVDAFTTIKGAILNLPQVITSIKNAFSQISTYYKNMSNIEMFKAIAIALVAFVASIWILSKIDADKAIAGMAAVAAIVWYLQKVMNSVASTNWNAANLKGAEKGIISLVGISLATLILAGAIAKVSKAFGNSPAGATVGLIAIYVIIEMMMRVMEKMSSMTNTMKRNGLFGSEKSSIATKAIKTMGLVMIEMAIAIRIMAGAINKITKAFDKNPTGAIFALASVAFLMEETARILKKLSVLDFGKKGIAKAGLAMAEIGVAVLLMAMAIKIISTAFKSDDPAPGIFALISVCVLMEVMVHALNKLSNSLGKGLTGIFGINAAASALVAVAISLAIVGATIAGLSLAYSKNPGATIAAVGTVIIALYGITKVLQGFKPEKAIGNAFALIEVAIALSLIGKAITKLSASYASNPFATIAAVGSMIGMLVAMSLIMSKVNPVKATMNASAMLEFSAALYLIGLAVAKVGSLGLKGALTGVGALIAVMLAIIGFAALASTPMVAAGFATLSASILSFGAALLMAGAGFSLFGIGLGLISAGVTALAAAWAVSGPLIVQGITGTLTAIAMAIPTVAAGLAHGLLTFIEILLDHIDVIVNLVKQIVISVIETVTELAPLIANALVMILMFALDLIANNIGPLVDKLLAIIINLINAIAARIPDILGAIKNLIEPIFNGIIDLASGLLSIVAEGIGEIFGSLIGGILEGLQKALRGVSFVDFADELSNFMLHLKPFVDGLNGLDKESMDAAMSLAGVITLLTADAIISGLTKWFAGDNPIEDFGKQLAAFGPYIKSYADSVAGIDVAAVEASAYCAQMLADFARTIPNEGGLLAKIVGDNDIETFGRKLALFGPYIKSYADSVKGLDVEAVMASVCAATMLSQFADTIPNEGGLLAKITGDNDIETFGNHLRVFGKSIAEYAREVKDIDAASVEASVSAARMLTEFANTIPNSGGLVSIFTGDNSVDKFGSQLVAFGYSIYNYYSYIKSIDITLVEKTTKALLDLLGVLGVSDSISTSSVANFRSILQELANSGINGFLKAMTSDSIDQVVEAIKTFVSTVNSTFETEIQTFIDNAQAKGRNFAAGFADGIAEIASVNGVKVAANALGDAAVQALGDSIGDPLEEPATETIPCGHSFDLGYEDGINDYADKPINAAEVLSNGTLNALDISDEAYVKGQNAAINFYNGINSARNNIKFDNSYLSDQDKRLQAQRNYGANSPGARRQNQQDSMNAQARLAMEKAGVSTDPYTYLGDAMRDYTRNADKAADSNENLSETYQNLSDNVTKATNSTNNLTKSSKGASSTTDKLANKIKSIMDKYENIFEDAKERANKDLFKSVDDQGDEFLDSVKDIMKQYENIYKTAVERTNSQDLFAEVDENDESFAPETLLNNLEDQVNQVNELNTIIGSLSGRIADNGLRAAISNMDVDDLPELRAMYRMDNSQLAKYEQMYKKKVQANQNKIQNELTGSLSQLTGQYTNVATYVATDASTNQLVKNLQSQVDKLNEYNDIIASLNGRIKDVNLREAIASMGVESIDELRMLNKMTDSELDQYTNLYKQKMSASAISIKNELQSELSSVMGSPIDIDEFYKSWKSTMDDVSNAIEEGGDAKNVGKTAGSQIAKGTTDGLGDSELKTRAHNTGAEITSEIADGITEEEAIEKVQTNIQSVLGQIKNYLEAELPNQGYKEVGGRIVQKICLGIEYVLKSREFQDEIYGIADKIERLFEARENTFVTIGRHIMDGIIRGMESRKGAVTVATIKAVNNVVKAAKNALDIHSPSRVFMGIGKYIDEGLAIGLRDYSNLAENEAGNMANGTVSAVQDAISQLSGMLDGSIDVNPTITPTLDLSEVNARSAALANMFNGRQVAVQAYADDRQTEMMTQLGNLLAEQNSEPRSITFNQTNNSPKALSRTEIYRQTRNGFSQLASALS